MANILLCFFNYTKTHWYNVHRCRVKGYQNAQKQDPDINAHCYHWVISLIRGLLLLKVPTKRA